MVFLIKNDAEVTIYLHERKMNLDTYIISHTKINSQWVRDLNMEGKMIRLIVQNIRISLCRTLHTQ